MGVTVQEGNMALLETHMKRDTQRKGRPWREPWRQRPVANVDYLVDRNGFLPFQELKGHVDLPCWLRCLHRLA